jgi:archaellum component FlaC
MSQGETETLLKTANDCAGGGECSLDDVSELISVLKEQQKDLSDRVQKVRKRINDLNHVNEKDDRKVDEVRETVRALFRVFQMDK